MVDKLSGTCSTTSSSPSSPLRAVPTLPQGLPVTVRPWHGAAGSQGHRRRDVARACRVARGLADEPARHVETPKLVALYKSGLLMIDEMVTNVYSLDNMNDRYQDIFDGKNIRGVITFDETDW
jgi:hypothetical protein